MFQHQIVKYFYSRLIPLVLKLLIAILLFPIGVLFGQASETIKKVTEEDFDTTVSSIPAELKEMKNYTISDSSHPLKTDRFSNDSLILQLELSLQERKKNVKLYVDSLAKEILISGENHSLSDFLKKNGGKLSGEIKQDFGYGTLKDYFGIDDSTRVQRYVINGNIGYQLGKSTLRVNFRKTSLPNSVGANDYFQIDFVPQKISPPIIQNPLQGSSSIEAYLDSLDIQNQRDLALIDVLSSKYERQIAKLKEEQKIHSHPTGPSYLPTDPTDSLIQSLEKERSNLETLRSEISNLKKLQGEMNLPRLDTTKLDLENGDKQLSLTGVKLGRSSISGIGPGEKSIPVDGVSVGLSLERFRIQMASGISKSNQILFSNPLEQALFSKNPLNQVNNNFFDEKQLLSQGIISFEANKSHQFKFSISHSCDTKMLDKGTNGSGSSFIDMKFKTKNGLRKLPFLLFTNEIGYLTKTDSTKIYSTNGTRAAYYRGSLELNFKKILLSVEPSYRRSGGETNITTYGGNSSNIQMAEVKTVKKFGKNIQTFHYYQDLRTNASDLEDSTSNIRTSVLGIDITLLKSLQISNSFQITNNQTNSTLRNYRASFRQFNTSINYHILENNTIDHSFTLYNIRTEGTDLSGRFEYNIKSFKYNRIEKTLESFVEFKYMKDQNLFMSRELSSTTIGTIKNIQKFKLEGQVKFAFDYLADQISVGGRISVLAQPFDSVHILFYAERHTFGDYLSMYQPIRFNYFPYEFGISLKMLLI
jgi:hypothetical protein